MHHLLVFEEELGVAAADTDLDAVVDGEFSDRNSHFIFSEPWNLLAIYYGAASATRARFNVPKWNSIARMQIWDVNRSNTIPSDPNVMDWSDYPLPIPLNEEIAIEGSNDLGAATENSTAILWVADGNWTRNIPRGQDVTYARFTAAVTTVQRAWSGLANLTFAETLRGGVFSVIGCECQEAGTQAFRLNFPRMPLILGRKLRPGGLVWEALGNVPWPRKSHYWGEWGKFHSFEPPQIQLYSNAAAGAATVEGRLHLVYHGERAAL